MIINYKLFLNILYQKQHLRISKQQTRTFSGFIVVSKLFLGFPLKITKLEMA